MEVNKLFNVKDKVVLVTGGAKGIGQMIARGFAANGAKVYITGRDAKACETLVSHLNSTNTNTNTNTRATRAVALPADLQSVKECESLVAKLSELEPNGLNILVNNAGAAWGQEIEAYPDTAWTKVLTLNLQRIFTLTQLCLPLLERAAAHASGSDAVPFSAPSRIINIGSIDGVRVPVVANYAYSASKAGLHHLSRHLARDLGRRGITSNTVACGPFRTKMMKATLDAFEESIVEGVPVGRIGKDEDVVGACLFLSSEAGAFVNGATMTLDGGASLVSKI